MTYQEEYQSRLKKINSAICRCGYVFTKLSYNAEMFKKKTALYGLRTRQGNGGKIK